VRRIPLAAALAALVLLSTIVRAWAGLRVPTPWIAADEMIYAELGRSLWETGHLDILGRSAPFYSLVHPALIGLPLAVFDTALGYDLARVLQALVMSLTAVPVFFWGRRLMSETWALGAAALTLAIPGLAYTGLLMSETVFVPVMTLAAWATASALERPTPRSQVLLVGAIVLAVLTRLQALVLVPAFLLALVVYALLERSVEPVRRLAYAIGGVLALGLVWMLTGGFGAYEPAGSSSYDLGNALKFVVYHAADAALLVGVVPACAVIMLALRPPPERAARAYLAVTLALGAGLIAEVGVFASRYVGRLAERDLLALAPLLFLGLCLWLARGAPRTRVASTVVALAVAGLVLTLPLGKLVHEAALPDAFTLVPIWQLGSYEALVWGFTGLAVLAFALLPARLLVAVPVALGLVFVGSSVTVSRYVANEASELKTSFFGTQDPEWVDKSATGGVSYFYDGEPHWNAVWEYVFWNRDIRGVYVLEGTRKVPGPMPQRFVDPFPLGQLADDAPPNVVGSTAFTFTGRPITSVEQFGLIHRGLVLWDVEPPLRLSTVLIGVQGSGDIYSNASITKYGCIGGRFEATFIAKGAPVTVRLDSGATQVEKTLQPEEIWRPSVPASSETSTCQMSIAPSGLVGSTRLEYVPG
jgi:Dolichyl-phosphate-mannose-protein mannosyltransferase